MNTNKYNSFTQDTGSIDSTMASHLSMKQALIDQQDDEVPEFSHSARHSVCSFHGKSEQRSWRKAFLGKEPTPNAPSLITPSSAELWEIELRRRGDEADRIDALPSSEQPAARDAEHRRKEQWDQDHNS
ncbi:hypothetical protein BDV95DRAFT_619868 [Massariosphaeria phaeospora]|uniref:Uncharacterized protein n=1 Tax=Massariosphaeria phaeospora TaxID=100035 RepID=A0A7C8ICY1_9PLEO|nr:hypothetical protein BDV95DRAFT_619868 [Massariosphaeria phaeospora]